MDIKLSIGKAQKCARKGILRDAFSARMGQNLKYPVFGLNGFS
jgi:hypothetical protein